MSRTLLVSAEKRIFYGWVSADVSVCYLHRWEDSSPMSFTHWGAGEPNNANGLEQCVQMNRHQGTGIPVIPWFHRCIDYLCCLHWQWTLFKGAWNDVKCSSKAGYVCKKFPGSTTPPPTTQPWEGNCPSGNTHTHTHTHTLLYDLYKDVSPIYNFTSSILLFSSWQTMFWFIIANLLEKV